MKCIDNSGESLELVLHFEDILAFTTGSPQEPPLGYDPQPELNFESDSMYPRANTCSNTLYLPLVTPPMDLEKFSFYFSSGILNSVGFGQV